MAKEQNNGMMKMAGVAVVSAAAGAVAAVMLTPKSGREMRSNLRTETKDLGNKAKSKAEDIIDK